MSTDLEQKARERFEKWAFEESEISFYRAKDGGEFIDLDTRKAEKAWQAAERSVVSDIVGRLEERIAELEERNYLNPARAELERQVAELKKEYLEK